MIRQATAEERHWYEREFYPLQDEILGAVGETSLILVGGTALARAYFHHRYSDDLDLFTPDGDVRPIARGLTAEWGRRGFDVEPETAGVSFARLWIRRGGTRLKIELASDRFLEPPVLWNGVQVATLTDLAANKVSAYEDRLAAKDVADLYYLTQRIPWTHMFDLAERKRIPVAYAEFAQFSGSHIEGDALIAEDIPESVFIEFAETLRQLTLDELKKKSRTYDPRAIVEELLWDAPRERRVADRDSISVIRRRLERMSLPKRMAVESMLGTAELDA